MRITGWVVGVGLVALAGSASAQDAGRFVTFGDSLSDPGNLFALTGGTTPGAGYFDGHFSNDITWSEMLAEPDETFFSAGVDGNVNYAFGGARVDLLGPLNGLTVVPGLVFGSLTPFVNAPPGVPVQLQSFINRGGAFGPHDVVMIWGGANDLFDLLDVAPGGTNDPTLPGFVLPDADAVAATAENAASYIVAVAEVSHTFGANTAVLLNLPDLGATPGYAGTASAALGTLYSTTFNQWLSDGVAALEDIEPDLALIEVDVASVLAAVRANPASFGFTNVTDACLLVPACAAGSAETQDGFLFWDLVHPTFAGHALVADTVEQYLYAPDYALQMAPLTTVMLMDRRAVATGMLDGIDPLTGGQDGWFSRGILHTGTDDGADWRAVGSTFGLTRTMSERWKGSVGLSVIGGQAGLDGMSTTLTGAALDIAAVYAGAGAYAKIAGGVGGTWFSDLNRATVGPLVNEAEADGVEASIIAELGTIHRFGPVALSPRGKLGYLVSRLGSFTEEGVVAPIAFDSRVVSTFLGGAELRAAVDLGTTGLSAFAVVGYEHLFGASVDDLSGTFASNPNLGASLAVDGPGSPGFVFGAGIAGPITDSLSLDVSYRGTSDGGAPNHQANAGLILRF